MGKNKEKLRAMIRELGDAISDNLIQSNDVQNVLQRIKDHGYQVDLSLAIGVCLYKDHRDHKEERPEQPLPCLKKRLIRNSSLRLIKVIWNSSIHFKSKLIRKSSEERGEKMQDRKIMLSEEEMPSSWYNILPDLPTPLSPPLHPGTHEPIGPEALQPIFPDALIEQEVSDKSTIPIPEEVLDIYRIWRPTPSGQGLQPGKEVEYASQNLL